MGNPSASGCAPVQSPMPLPKGPSRHRQSLSISSLPLDKLGRINCEKETSVSAHSSPVKVALTHSEKLSIATLLGHGQAKHQDFARRKVPSGTEELYLKGIELATDDQKPISFNPFRGHRSVGSGSFATPCISASEYSPRARSGSISTSSSKTLDKYAVAKIAASLIHSPAKLERSMSSSRVAHRSAPDVAKKGDHGPSLAVGEVVLPANLGLSPFLQEKAQFMQSADVEDEGKRSSSSDSDLAMDMEDTNALQFSKLELLPIFKNTISISCIANPLCVLSEPSSQQISNASSMQQNTIDITKMLESEGEGEGEAEQVEQPATVAVEDPPPTAEDITSEFPSPHSQVSLNAAEKYTHIVNEEDSAPEDVLSSPSGSQSSCMASTETGVQLPSTGSPPPLESQDTGHESPEYIAALFEDATVEESNNIAVDDNLQLLLLATEEVPEDTELTDTAARSSLSSEKDDPTSAVSTDSEGESLPIPSIGSSEERDMNIQVPEMKSMVRKRRRSVSASGIGAMLLKVVRVSDSAQMVTRRMPKVGSPELILSGVEALRARKYVLEKTAQISMGPAHEESALISSANSTPVHVCQTESEDAIKSTYSKFVDIEIDPGGDCIELVQHSKDAQDSTGFGVASTFETRQGNQQATPGTSLRHLQDHENITCTAHQGILNHRFDTQTKVSPFPSSNKQTAHDRHGERPSKEPNSRARINSSDIDSLKECLKTVKTANSDNDGLDQAHTTLSSSNLVPTSTRERSRIIVSRLQAPTSGAFSRVDVYRPCSTVSILANPSSSSSHQDKLWEEQAEIYSSGGRGTPGREDEATTANVIINLRKSPLPAFVTDSCADREVNPSLRRAGVVESSGKKRGRPNTPLRSLMDDQRRRASPESGHFIQQIMSRIRGSNSPKASVFPKSSSQLATEKRRNTWSSCICFSVK